SQLRKQMAGERDAQSRDRKRIMPFRPDASPGAGSPAATGALVIQDGRCALRGKNDSVRPPGIHKPRYREWHGDEIPASHALRNDPNPTPASVLRVLSVRLRRAATLRISFVPV